MDTRKMTTPEATIRPASVLAASLVLPGLASLCLATVTPALADTPPEKSTIAAQLGVYQDEQPGWQRVRAVTPQVYYQAPVGQDYSVTVNGGVDAVSGASPRWHTQHTQVSGASKMHDSRVSSDVKVSRYFAQSTVSALFGFSREHDYDANVMALDARWSSDDRNRTWSLGLGVSDDHIGQGEDQAKPNHRQTFELMAGWTQVLTPVDILQVNLTRSQGRGYYNDPYKSFDIRPDVRNASILAGRWNHHIAASDTTVRSQYRYYSDTFGIRSHTLGAEVVQPMGRWTLKPGVRYYSQSAANFYLDPILDAQGQYDQLAVMQRAIARQGYQSTDQRLSAFGALTLSLGLSYAITPDTSLTFKYSDYRQRASWRLGGQASVGLDPFNARFVQIGFVHQF